MQVAAHTIAAITVLVGGNAPLESLLAAVRLVTESSTVRHPIPMIAENG
jgi:hypothetical protein